jgi:hypothetical protein
MLFVPLLGIALQPLAHAATITDTGTFSADNSVFEVPFTVTSPQNYTFLTTSYASGGFVPALTLFGSNGVVIGNDGADHVCYGGATGMCDDAFLQKTLGAGSYTLALTEFPNEAIGTLADGFLFASDPTITGDVCGVSGGMFLETDVAPCLQRTNSYSLTINSVAATPEPPSWALLLAPAALLMWYSRRRQMV